MGGGGRKGGRYCTRTTVISWRRAPLVETVEQVAGWDQKLRETQAELFSLADDVQKLVLGQQVSD